MATIHAPRRFYTFIHANGKPKSFGPYATEDEAADAFMWVYGYAPADAIRTEPYRAGMPAR